MKGTRSRNIMHYPTIPEKWPVKAGTNLTQAEVLGLEAAGFKLEDGEVGVGQSSDLTLLHEEVAIEPRPPTTSGDYRPTSRDNKPFRYVSEPSPEHFSKLDKSKHIECTIVKFVKVAAPGYGIIYTIHTPGSVARQQLYEVTIGDFPACTCMDFISMKTSALGRGKKKWILCKHLYFILQRYMGCTAEDVFIHCPAWTFNEVQMLLDRADWAY